MGMASFLEIAANKEKNLLYLVGVDLIFFQFIE